MNRVADNSLAKKLLGWEPEVKFIDGLHRTIDWYFATKDREQLIGERLHSAAGSATESYTTAEIMEITRSEG